MITPSYELDSDTFLSQVFARNAEVRTVHITSTGTVTMSSGDVHYSSGEGALVYKGDSRGHIKYEGCTFPIVRGVFLCSIEWVELGGVRYEREETSEGQGEWNRVERVQTQSTDPCTPHDPAEIPEYWSRSYGLVELNSEIIDGVEYRRFRASYNPIRLMLQHLEAGELEPPARVPREALIEILQRQAEVETGTRELWARADDSTVWRIITQRDWFDASTSVSFRYFVPRKTYDVLEYSRYNEPVVIKPPI